MDIEFRSPETIEETVGLLAEYGDDATLLAGGTALAILMRHRLLQPRIMIGLQRVSELTKIQERDRHLSIGALATQRAVETSSLVSRFIPVLAETLRTVATTRIRNVATLGGNLVHADTAQDPPVTLMALGARVRLVSLKGERIVPLDEFFTYYYETVLRPDELLVEVDVPFMPPLASANFFKFLPRTADDYATVAACTCLTLDAGGTICEDVRIVFGAVGSTPIRAHGAEAVLRGKPGTEAAFRDAAAAAKSDLDPMSDIRGSADYKKRMAEVIVRRSLLSNLRELTSTSDSGEASDNRVPGKEE